MRAGALRGANPADYTRPAPLSRFEQSRTAWSPPSHSRTAPRSPRGTGTTSSRPASSSSTPAP